MKSIYLSNVIVESITQNNLEMLKTLVEDVVPKLDAQSQKDCYKAMGESALLAQDQEITQYCLSFSKLTKESAIALFRNIASDGFDGVDDAMIDVAIANLGSRAGYAISSLLLADEKLFQGEDIGRRNDLIVKVVDSIGIDPTLLDGAGSYGSRGLGSNLSNLALSKSFRLFEKMGYGKKFKIDSLKSIAQFGCDVKLTADEVPRLVKGVLLNPELVIQSLNKFSSAPIPVFMKNDLRLPSEMASKEYAEYPEFQHKTKLKSHCHINLSLRPMSNPFFYAMADRNLQVGFSAPIGYRLALVMPEALTDVAFGDVSSEIMSKCERLLDTLWVNPETDRFDFTYRAVDSISACEFIDLYEKDHDFAKEFDRSRFNEPEFLTSIANVFSADYPDTRKTTEYSSYSSNIKIICKIKELFNIQPSGGFVFTTSPADVDLLHASNIVFDNRFTPFPTLTKSITDTFTMDTYRKIADMRGSVCVGSEPLNAKEAMQFAIRRKSQPMNVALLRRFELTELMDLVREDVEYEMLFNAFPEQHEALIPYLSNNTKRKIISEGIDL